MHMTRGMGVGVTRDILASVFDKAISFSFRAPRLPSDSTWSSHYAASSITFFWFRVCLRPCQCACCSAFAETTTIKDLVPAVNIAVFTCHHQKERQVSSYRAKRWDDTLLTKGSISTLIESIVEQCRQRNIPVITTNKGELNNLTQDKPHQARESESARVDYHWKFLNNEYRVWYLRRLPGQPSSLRIQGISDRVFGLHWTRFKILRYGWTHTHCHYAVIHFSMLIESWFHPENSSLFRCWWCAFMQQEQASSSCQAWCYRVSGW